jgi:hypothetical protein
VSILPRERAEEQKLAIRRVRYRHWLIFPATNIHKVVVEAYLDQKWRVLYSREIHESALIQEVDGLVEQAISRVTENIRFHNSKWVYVDKGDHEDLDMTSRREAGDFSD